MTEEQRLLTNIESQQYPFSSHILPNKGKPEERIHPGLLHTNKSTCFLLPGGLYKQGNWNLPWPLSLPISKLLINPYPRISPAKPPLVDTTEQRGGMEVHLERIRCRGQGGCAHWNISEHKGLLWFLEFHQGTEALCPSHPTGQLSFP